MPQCRWISMVMMICSCLVSITRVKGNTFINVCVTIPSLLSAGISSCVPCASSAVRKCIPGIEHTDSVNHQAYCSASGFSLIYYCDWIRWVTRKTVYRSLIVRVVRKKIGAKFVCIPRPHNITSEVGCADIDPLVCIRNLVNTCIGRFGLRSLTSTPSCDGT